MRLEKYRFPEKLVEGLIKARPNRFIMRVQLGKKLLKCHCPVTGRIGNLRFSNIPCLLSMSNNPERKTPCTVEAISLDPPAKKNKSWIGINQTKANEYIAFFMRTGQMEKMIGKKHEVQREVPLGKSRIDFLVNGNTYVEAKTMVMMIPSEKHPNYTGGNKPLTSFDRMIKHFHDLGAAVPKGSRAIILLCFPYDAIQFVPPKRMKGSGPIKRAARKAQRAGVENWQINLKFDEKGVQLLQYFPLRLF
ncbi:MAG: DNA/RNA nuclease SfsA [Candidatus Micrarchaeota archaeon]